MKKRILLAMAALAMFSGSVMAQTEVTVLGTGIPAAQAVNATSIMADGVWGADFGGVGNTTQNATDPIRMTTDGTYQFQATTSDWATTVGASWNTLFAGSMFEFVGAGVAFVEASGTADDGASALLSGNTAFNLTLTANGATTFSFQEHIIELGGTTIAEAVGCGAAYNVGITEVDEVAWATGAATDLTVDVTAVCKSAIADGSVNVLIELANNANIDDYYIQGALTGPAGSSILFGATTFEAATTDGSLTLAVFGKAKAIHTLADYNGALPGIYTFTLSRATDNIASNATNAATLGIVAADQKTVDFAVLPAPTPTLTTSTIK